MKFLVITHYNKLYGANKSLLGIVQYLRNQGNTVEVITPPYKGELHYKLDTLKIKYHILRYSSPLIEGELSLWELILKIARKFIEVYRLSNIILRTKPDYIYSNSSAVDIGILACFITGKKHIWHIREFGDLDYGVKPFYGFRIQNKLIKASFKRIYVSKALLDYYKDKSKHNSTTIYNGVIFKNELANFNINKKLNQGFNIGYVGLLHPGKNIKIIIEAFSEFIKKNSLAELHLYGSGEKIYRDELYKYIEDLNLNRFITFHGFVENTFTIYSNIDCLIMASKFEAFGRVSAEAMLNGVPVIGNFSGGGTKELIEDGLTGLLFDGTADDLLIKLKLLHADKGLYKSIIYNGKTYAVQNFVIDDQVGKIIDFIES